MERGSRLVLLILSCVFALSGCMSVLYSPRVGPMMFYSPEKLGYKPTDLETKDAEGNKIHAWLFPSKTGPSRGTVIHFHGNAENLTSHYAMMVWLTDAGYDYVIFDYPGYGLSSGEPTAKNTVEAGEAVMRMVHSEWDSRPLIIYGQSLGGMVAQKAVVDMKGKIPMCDVILDSTFSSYKSVTRRKLSQFWITWLLQPLAYVLMSDSQAADPADISPIPVLVIHGDADRVVEFPNGEKLFERLKEPKEFWRIPGSGHGQTFRINGQENRQRLLDRLSRTCPASPKAI